MRQRLARQQQAGRARLRTRAAPQRLAPGHRGFGGIARSPYIDARNQSQAGRVFHRLMGRAVLAEADRVVGEHIGDRQVHQRRHAYRVARVVGEGEEGAAVRTVATVQRDAVHHRRHAEFAHAVMHVVAGAVALQRPVALPVGQVGAGQVGRAAQQFRNRGCHDVQRVLRGLAGGDRCGARFCGFAGGFERTQCVRRERGVAAQAPAQFGRQFGKGLGIVVDPLLPGAVGGGAALLRRPSGAQRLRNLERCRTPAQRFAGERDLGVAQRLAVRLGGAGAVGRTLADARPAAHQHRLVAVAGGRDGGVQRHRVVTVHIAHHGPAIGFEAGWRVVGEPAAHVAIDRDAVVVVEHDQLVQLPGAGQRTHFVADAFHQAAVADEGPGAVVDHRVARPVEFGGKQLFGECHADRVGDALAERAGGGFHPRRDVDLRMARRA